MWLFNRRPRILGAKVTVEDLQVMTKAYTENPEYFRFIQSMRDQRQKALDFAPVLKSEADVYAHGLRCHAIQRDIQLLQQLIEMPLTAQAALLKFKTKNDAEAKAPEAQEPWDEPLVPEEGF